MGFGFNQQLDFKQSTYQLYLTVDAYYSLLKKNEESAVELTAENNTHITQQIDLFNKIRSNTKLNAHAPYKGQLDNIFKNIVAIRNNCSTNYKYSDLTSIRTELNTLIFLIENQKLDIEQNVTQKSSTYSFLEKRWHWIKKHKITIALSIAVVIGSVMTAGAVGAIAGGVWGGFALIGGGITAGLGGSSISTGIVLGVVTSVFAGVAIIPAVNKLKKIAKWTINRIIDKSLSLFNAVSDLFSKKSESDAVISPALSPQLPQQNSVAKISSGLGVTPGKFLSNKTSTEVPKDKKVEYRARSFSLPIPKNSLGNESRSQCAFSI